MLYRYYAFDNRPLWFRMLWMGSDILRRVVSRCPHGLRYAISQGIAACVYFPLARFARLAEKAGMGVSRFPRSYYRGLSFYTIRAEIDGAADSGNDDRNGRAAASWWPRIKRLRASGGNRGGRI